MKKYIDTLTKNEKIISFTLIINLLVNIIIYFISKNYQENLGVYDRNLTKFFYPFVQLDTEFLRGKYENTKLVGAYNLPEFLVYGLFPIIVFLIWMKFFKTENKTDL